MPGLSGTSRLPARIGTGRSIEMVLGGDTVDGNRAYELRIVEHVVASKEVIDFSIELMRKMTEDRPLSVIHSIVRAINNFGRLPAYEAMEEETMMFCRLAADEARREKK
jgi:enoyl-CoA hydratase